MDSSVALLRELTSRIPAKTNRGAYTLPAGWQFFTVTTFAGQISDAVNTSLPARDVATIASVLPHHTHTELRKPHGAKVVPASQAHLHR